MENTKKPPYEPPVIIDLSGSVAHAQDEMSRCNKGANVTGINCRAGGSPTHQCYAGSAASGGECGCGSVATDQCKTGRTAAASRCRNGFLASSGCKTGYIGG